MDKLINDLGSLPVGEIKVVPVGAPGKTGTVRPRICACQCQSSATPKR
ncbi:hypothetical protein [Streptomyces enissocaesilis]|uniref:Uncharacterized protein n=1 Tax=Streptomyces enissocaesilis TaxID=332589 RepID=A0ABN3WQ71_9ACTN